MVRGETPKVKSKFYDYEASGSAKRLGHSTR